MNKRGVTLADILLEVTCVLRTLEFGPDRNLSKAKAEELFSRLALLKKQGEVKEPADPRSKRVKK